MSDKTCPYCYPDTAGNHQDCCPNFPHSDPHIGRFIERPSAAHTADDEAYTPFENDLFRQRMELEAKIAELQRMLDDNNPEMVNELADFVDAEITQSVLNYASTHGLKEEIIYIIRNWTPKGE